MALGSFAGDFCVFVRPKERSGQNMEGLFMINSFGTSEDNIKVMDWVVMQKANLVDKILRLCQYECAILY